METYHDKLIRQSYCAAERLYAGEYPGDKGQERAIDKLKDFLAFGITHFVDLTEEGELTPYAHLLPEGVAHRRFPIVDVSVLYKDLISKILLYLLPGWTALLETFLVLMPRDAAITIETAA